MTKLTCKCSHIVHHSTTQIFLISVMLINLVSIFNCILILLSFIYETEFPQLQGTDEADKQDIEV